MPFTPRFHTLLDIFEHATSSYRARPLFGTRTDSAWRWMSYGEFRDRVEATRRALSHFGVVPGDRVAIIANNCPEWAILAYACYGLRAATVPMYEAQKAEDWRYILADSQARMVFVADTTIADRVGAFADSLDHLHHVVVLDPGDDTIGEGTLTFGVFLDRSRDHQAPLAPPRPDDLCGMIYTSGTTGAPKGVLLSHRNIATNLSAVHGLFPEDPDETSLSFLPWAHSFGQTVELHGMISVGGAIAIAQSVPRIVDNLAEVRPTVLVSVPRVFNTIYDGVHKKVAESSALERRLFDAAMATARRRRALATQGQRSAWVELQYAVLRRLVLQKIRDRFGGRLRYALSGGAALSKTVGEFMEDIGVLVYEGYGLTETSPIATCNWPHSRRLGTVGKPIPGVRIQIDTPAQDGADGEIIVHGHNVMLGYHGLPDDNARVFTDDGGLRTGDTGHFDADGFLVITGRIKEQYKLENGRYVVPTPLEEAITLSLYIANVMVLGDNRPYNVALVVPDVAMLQRWARARHLDVDDDALLAHPDVRSLIADEIAARSDGFKRYELVRRFALLGQDFTTASGLLTPTLKLKRAAVTARYARIIESLYE